MSEQTSNASNQPGSHRPQQPPKPLTDRQVKAGAAELVREAKRILRKYRQKIAPEPVAAIEQSTELLSTYRADRNWAAARGELEHLDELLHQHAAFARKGLLRELTENVSLAILFALGLRSCFYEPFKIPSGSMMPTLRSGDHIFVNKFTYGIQIPFTTTVVGQWVGDIGRGDVVVFRYPINEEEDFIKRVIGTPGDTVRVDGEEVSIRRAGQEDFEVVQRTRIDEPCRDETGTQVIGRCALFEETLDGKTYVVRYTTPVDPRTGVLTRRAGEWTVPEGHFLVMGDNRNQSHDSLAWTKTVEAVAAEGVLAPKDMRDLTPEKMFRLNHPDDRALREVANYDHLRYTAEHRSTQLAQELEVWRSPTLGRGLVFETAASEIASASELTFEQLVEGDAFLATHEAERTAILDAAGQVEAMVGHIDRQGGYHVALNLGPADAVVTLKCGRAACQTDGEFAQKLAKTITEISENPQEDARNLLTGNPSRYQPNWTSRGLERDKFLDRTFTAKGEPADDPRNRVRIRAFRDSQEHEGFVYDTALLYAQQQLVPDGAGEGETTGGGADNEALPELAGADSLGDEAKLAEHPHGITIVNRLPNDGIIYVLECGAARCESSEQAVELAATIDQKAPAAARDARRLAELLVAADIGWKEVANTPVPKPGRYEYDRMRLEGVVQAGEYSLDLFVWRQPPEGLEAKLKQLAEDVSAQPDGSVAEGGYSVTTDREYIDVFAIPTAELVIQVNCRFGLCPQRDNAIELARRALEKGRDTTNYIDVNAERPYPFVPRGNIKGRADRIWLPTSRFWLPIR